ncbi:MAG TPA: glycosyltransferase family protein [Gemmatimonadaceae bacterium]|nr:glycosyltransferase family protein [Gemmatimonadaceae bacterium]
MADRQRVVAIVQARMASTRLPGKAMLPIAGKPMLELVLDRVGRSKMIDEVVVATSTEKGDDVIADYCGSRACRFSRGSEEDVLSRYRDAAVAFDADIVVRITSDCPLMDPTVLDLVVSRFLEVLPAVDYAANTLPPRTFPRGLDVEVFSIGALERAFVEDQDPRSREHVTPYIYRHPEIFELLRVPHVPDLSEHRWTVDTPEDLALVRAVYDDFEGQEFSYVDVVAFLQRSPLITGLNSRIVQKELKESP